MFSKIIQLWKYLWQKGIQVIKIFIPIILIFLTLCLTSIGGIIISLIDQISNDFKEIKPFITLLLFNGLAIPAIYLFIAQQFAMMRLVLIGYEDHIPLIKTQISNWVEKSDMIEKAKHPSNMKLTVILEGWLNKFPKLLRVATVKILELFPVTDLMMAISQKKLTKSQTTEITFQKIDIFIKDIFPHEIFRWVLYGLWVLNLASVILILRMF